MLILGIVIDALKITERVGGSATFTSVCHLAVNHVDNNWLRFRKSTFRTFGTIFVQRLPSCSIHDKGGLGRRIGKRSQGQVEVADLDATFGVTVNRHHSVVGDKYCLWCLWCLIRRLFSWRFHWLPPMDRRYLPDWRHFANSGPKSFTTPQDNTVTPDFARDYLQTDLPFLPFSRPYFGT